MSTRQQFLVLALFVVVVLPLGLAGVAGSAGFGPVEVGIWFVLIVAVVVSIFTWGRGPREPRSR